MGPNFDEYVRELCRRATAAEDEDELQEILSQLRTALSRHITSLRDLVASHVLGSGNHPQWNGAPESDAPVSGARQPYHRRERESADGFVTWVRLSNRKAPGKSGNPN